MGHYYPDSIMGAMTDYIVDRGEKLLQVFRLCQDERDHAYALAAEMGYRPGQTVLDVGCGTGWLGGYLSELEPSLTVKLLNYGEAQLKHAPPNLEKTVGDSEDLPYEDNSADGLILSYILGHTKFEKTIGEAHRVLRPGGWLFLYELNKSGPVTDEFRTLNYWVRGATELATDVEDQGFELTLLRQVPRTFISNIVRDANGQDAFDVMFRNIVPCIFRFERKASLGSAHEA